ncbi:MAG: ATP-binding protein, partial [candidate division Zixibacteria bacterium]|nr:ATP-binding protein [candidate division Zixibacteria bacterium]
VNGLFGHGLFHPNQSHESLAKDLPLLVTEGEFNQLQLQSLCVRINEASGQEPDYVNACAVGGVDNADYETIARVSKKPVFCYDNDENQAGFALVTKAQRTMHVAAFTTPEIESDLDSFIRSFGDSHQEAWGVLQELVSSRKQYERGFDSIRQEIKDLRYKRKKAFHLNADVANAIIGDLRERGEFYNDGFRSYVFLNARKELIPVDRDETQFALLLDEYGINRADTLFKWIFEALGVEGVKNGQKTEIRRFAYYDKRAHTVYVTDFANQMYRITPERIDLVDNGTEGVLFVTDPLAEPYEIHDRESAESFLDKHLISRVNLCSDRLSPDQRRLLLLLWIVSIFFESIMPTKAILVFIGERGSGKSTACRLLGKILFGSKFDVIPMPPKEDDFDTAATNATYLVVDNADTRKAWFLDKLAVAATGGSTQKRQLYTDNRIARFPLKCYISVTSREPRFRRDDVASRLLLMKVDRLGDQIVSESDLRDEILSIRNQLMTEILYFVQDALKGLRENSKLKVTSSFRMADFASFAIRIAEFGGIRDEIETILRLTEGEQSDFTIEDDPIVDLLKEWTKENITEEITATQLCVELAKIAEDKNIGFYYKGKERAFAQKFRHLVSDLGEQFEIAHRMVHGGRRLYTIKLKIETA